MMLGKILFDLFIPRAFSNYFPGPVLWSGNTVVTYYIVQCLVHNVMGAQA